MRHDAWLNTLNSNSPKMASNNPFKSLSLDRDRFQEAVESFGATDYAYHQAGNMFHLACRLRGQPFRMGVFENKDGTTTLSCLQGYDKGQFDDLGEHIRGTCSAGSGGRFDVSIPKFPAKHANCLLEYLTDDATVERQQQENGYVLTKLKGRYGDTLTIKVYGNGTIQLQGRSGMLAARAQDYLTNVLSYAEAVRTQIELFSVPVSLKDVQNETSGRLPDALARLNEVVCAQLASALALTKVNIELADYGAVAFPALRGLEGFLKSELAAAGLEPQYTNNFGEYFKQGAIVGSYEMYPEPAEKVGTKLAAGFVECYTLYASQRHGIVHMSPDPAASRLVSSLDEARSIVFRVFETIERFCRKLTK